MFETDYHTILEQIQQFNPLEYAKSRNYIHGSVSRLSPYISRGVISTLQVMQMLLDTGHRPLEMEKFLQELAWRDYWQHTWRYHHHWMDQDSKSNTQVNVRAGIPENILKAATGIQALDNGIETLYKTGYMHNHVRLYVASVACNMASCHWYLPAKWLYFHLLDADWASNALSWQWVAGINSHKLYFANQDNINNFCNTRQFGTFLDVPYSAFEHFDIPDILNTCSEPEFITPLPEKQVHALDPLLPTLIYNFYNLDPNWRSGIRANRIVLLEPSVFEQFPVSKKSIDFCIELAQKNIPGIQVMVAEFSELKPLVNGPIYYKEHPLNHLYQGNEDPRDRMADVSGDFPSFFAYWKVVKKVLF